MRQLCEASSLLPLREPLWDADLVHPEQILPRLLVALLVELVEHLTGEVGTLNAYVEETSFGAPPYPAGLAAILPLNAPDP